MGWDNLGKEVTPSKYAGFGDDVRAALETIPLDDIDVRPHDQRPGRGFLFDERAILILMSRGYNLIQSPTSSAIWFEDRLNNNPGLNVAKGTKLRIERHGMIGKHGPEFPNITWILTKLGEREAARYERRATRAAPKVKAAPKPKEVDETKVIIVAKPPASALDEARRTIDGMTTVLSKTSEGKNMMILTFENVLGFMKAAAYLSIEVPNKAELGVKEVPGTKSGEYVKRCFYCKKDYPVKIMREAWRNQCGETECKALWWQDYKVKREMEAEGLDTKGI